MQSVTAEVAKRFEHGSDPSTDDAQNLAGNEKCAKHICFAKF